MALHPRNLIFVLFVLLTAPSVVFSQGTPPPSSVRATVVRFFYYSLADASDGKFDPTLKTFLQNQNKREKIEVSPGGFSTTITYYGDGPLDLYKEVKTATGIERSIIASVPLPPQSKGVLYIVTHDEKNFAFTPLPYTSEGMPPQHVKVLNLCPETLAIKIADQQVLVPARGEATLNATVKDLVLPIKVGRQQNGVWRMQIETALPGLTPEQRLLYVFVPDSPQFRGINMMQLGELPPPPPQPLDNVLAAKPTG